MYFTCAKKTQKTWIH